MKISVIDTGFFKLDGGAMFGVVPQRLWKRLNPPDAQNMCTWAMRCLLIEMGDRKILVDTGLGNKQNEKFRSHFEPHGEATLLGSLAGQGLSPEQITDVFLTHLHFDHAGGAVQKTVDGILTPTFPNAAYWTNQLHLEWANNPNPRERASFLKENFQPLTDANKWAFMDIGYGLEQWLPGIKVQRVDGHTEAMMILHLEVGDKKLIYCADLFPSSFHVAMPYVMAYDIRPLVTMEEKKIVLEEAMDKGAFLFFEHDPVTEVASITKDHRGRVVVKDRLNLKDIFD